jgi:polysaccharide export outer membrane protein
MKITSELDMSRHCLAAFGLHVLVVFALLCAAVPASAQLARNDGQNSGRQSYLIQPGDLLEVSVWREEYLERDVHVQPDGMISFPLAGVLEAAGKTVGEIQQAVGERLSQYIPDPVVTVSIKEIRGNRIYVIGQVQKPGQFIMNPTIDIVQALALAGGTTPFAELNDIRVLRRDGNELVAINFRYGDVEKGRNLQQNIILQSGDVIIVP